MPDLELDACALHYLSMNIACTKFAGSQTGKHGSQAQRGSMVIKQHADPICRASSALHGTSDLLWPMQDCALNEIFAGQGKHALACCYGS